MKNKEKAVGFGQCGPRLKKKRDIDPKATKHEVEL